MFRRTVWTLAVGVVLAGSLSACGSAPRDSGRPLDSVGTESIEAVAIAVTRFVAPGPEVASAQPSLPDARA